MTKTNVTASQTKAGLIDQNGAKWAVNITYSVPGTGAVWEAAYQAGEPTDPQYGTFDSTQADNFRSVMEVWDRYIAPSMNEVSDAAPGQIRIAFTDVTARAGNSVAAYAYTPPSGGEIPVNGDIWVDETYKSSPFSARSAEYQLLLHESGHSLGLKHPFETPTLPAGYDSTTYTVMSYTSEDNFYTWSGGGGSINVNTTDTVSFTPMVLDILAIQLHYGVDRATGAGNTTYVFTDSDLNGRQAIYDAGGADTIDLSALSRGSHVDLRPGAYSDLDYYNVEDQISDLTDKYGSGFESFIREQMTNPDRPAYEWERNLGLSFSTTIENVIGSSKADSIIGNDVANVIDGRGGADKMEGGKGNDTYIVNNSSDKVFEAANAGNDIVKTSVSFVLGASSYVETLQTTLQSGAGTIDLTGNTLGQGIVGNDGVNKINGLGGDDKIFGLKGNDVLTGGTGKDTFFFTTQLSSTGNVDRITDFNVADDTMRLENGIFTKLAVGTLSPDAFWKSTAGTSHDTTDRIVYDTDSGALYYDADGGTAGGVAAIKFAIVGINLALTNADFAVA